MLVEIIIACHIIQKMLFNIQNHQNWPHQFSCVSKFAVRDVASFVTKTDFFEII